MILINVERDSVCMGDDVNAPHFYSFKLPINTTLNDAFEHLSQQRYLPSISGINHFWEILIDDEFIAKIIGNNHIPESSSKLSSTLLEYTTNGILNVRFKYTSSNT